MKNSYGEEDFILRKIAILVADSNGRYPIPASKGGAVSQLIEHLVNCNQREKLADLHVITYWDKDAEQMSQKYTNTVFEWVRISKATEIFDSMLFNFIRRFFPRKKAISYRSLFSLLHMIRTTHGILNRNDFDAVVIENNIPSLNAIRRLQKKYDSKCYLHLHNVPRTNGLCKKIVHGCKNYFVVSDFVGHEIEKESNAIGPVEEKKVKTFYNCVDTELFRPINIDDPKIQAIREKYSITSSDRVILFTGRLSPEKGADKLLEAADNFRTRNVVILVVGGVLNSIDLKDEFTERLSKLADGLNNSGKCRVIATGYIQNEELPYYYNLADVSILPSTWDEPAGLTMVESMACGTPVITTRAGGIPEYVDDCGIVLENDEKLPSRIAVAFDELIEDGNKSQQYSLAGKKRVQENFSSRMYLNNFMKLFS